MNDFDPIEKVKFIHGFLKRDMDVIRKFLLSTTIEVTDSEYPYLDVVERNLKLLIFVELPGLDLDDFMVYQYDNLIIIEGGLSKACFIDKVNYLRMERHCVYFRRIVRLPNENMISSKSVLRHGVLTLEFTQVSEIVSNSALED